MVNSSYCSFVAKARDHKILCITGLPSFVLLEVFPGVDPYLFLDRTVRTFRVLHYKLCFHIKVDLEYGFNLITLKGELALRGL